MIQIKGLGNFRTEQEALDTIAYKGELVSSYAKDWKRPVGYKGPDYAVQVTMKYLLDVIDDSQYRYKTTITIPVKVRILLTSEEAPEDTDMDEWDFTNAKSELVVDGEYIKEIIGYKWRVEPIDDQSGGYIGGGMMFGTFSDFDFDKFDEAVENFNQNCKVDPERMSVEMYLTDMDGIRINPEIVTNPEVLKMLHKVPKKFVSKCGRKNPFAPPRYF